jgi:excisionase family DNA binding protein
VDKKLLTVEAVAESWNVSVSLVRKLIWQGRLPAVRIGRVVRVDPDVVLGVMSQGV